MVVNDVRGLKVEFHILQSFPVTCLNRDDVGAPKTAVVGGTIRARVSSQCWKRAVRIMMRELMGEDNFHLGKRTKYISQLVAKRCQELGANKEQSKVCGDAIASKLSGKKDERDSNQTDTLLFISPSEIEKICQFLKEKGFSHGVIKNVTIKDMLELRSGSRSAMDAYDIALFGRMVAVEPILNIEGATSFSHAISTHKIVNEIDFFTAVDDEIQEKEDETGSAHMGILEYNSATYYRYVGVNVTQLYETFGEDKGMTIDAMRYFIKALFLAVPTGKQASMAGLSGWDYARIYVRRGQGLQVMFDSAIRQGEHGGYLKKSREFLRKYLEEKERLYGSLFRKVSMFEIGEGAENGVKCIDELIDKIIIDVESHLV